MAGFPNSPSLNDTYTLGDKTWEWDGTMWRIKTTGAVGPQGNQGNQGNAGSAGSNGVQGPQGNQGNAGSAGSNGVQGPQGNQGPSGSSEIFYQNTTPSGGSVSPGDLWFDSDTGSLFVYFNDGDSSQWVEVGNGQKGDAGPAGVSVFSYHGHIESPVNKVFYIDQRLPADRTIDEFYAISGTGSCDAELRANGTVIGTMQVGVTGATASLSNTSITAQSSLVLDIDNVNLCFDLRFAIKYTQ
jgi:hypothetical protein